MSSPVQLICVNDEEEVSVGFLGSAKKKLDALTKGKAYTVFSTIQANRVGFFAENATTIRPEDICFLVYDDLGSWSLWDVSRFAPSSS